MVTLRIALFASASLFAIACTPTEPAIGEDGGTSTTSPPPAPSSPVGSWVTATAADTTAAGFSGLTVAANGTWTETGRTDDETPSGTYTEPSTFTLDPSYGNPPAGLHGPYLDLDNAPNGDGDWVYAWSTSDDNTKLTLTCYAQRKGMGLRWVSSPFTFDLVAK